MERKAEEKRQHDAKFPCEAECLRQLTEIVEELITCELPFPETAQIHKDLYQCQEPGCDGTLVVKDESLLNVYRQKNVPSKYGSSVGEYGYDPKLLQCNKCTKEAGCRTTIINTLIGAYSTIGLNDPPIVLSEDKHPESLQKLKWDLQHSIVNFNLEEQEDGESSRLSFQIQLDQCAEAVDSNTHDPKHRTSCFKKEDSCRYYSPHDQEERTKVEVITDEDSNKITGVLILYKRRPPFLWVSSYCPYLTKICPGNNYIKLVLTYQVSFYICAYMSKHDKSERKDIENSLKSFNNYRMRTDQVNLDNPSSKTDFGKGLGILISSTWGYTKDTMVPATTAALCNESVSLYEISHVTALVKRKSRILIPIKKVGFVKKLDPNLIKT